MAELSVFIAHHLAQQRTEKRHGSTCEDSASVSHELVNPPTSHVRLKGESLEDKKARKQLVKQERKVQQWVLSMSKVECVTVSLSRKLLSFSPAAAAASLLLVTPVTSGAEGSKEEGKDSIQTGRTASSKANPSCSCDF